MPHKEVPDIIYNATVTDLDDVLIIQEALEMEMDRRAHIKENVHINLVILEEERKNKKSKKNKKKKGKK